METPGIVRFKGECLLTMAVLEVKATLECGETSGTASGFQLPPVEVWHDPVHKPIRRSSPVGLFESKVPLRMADGCRISVLTQLGDEHKTRISLKQPLGIPHRRTECWRDDVFFSAEKQPCEQNPQLSYRAATAAADEPVEKGEQACADGRMREAIKVPGKIRVCSRDGERLKCWFA